MESICVFEMPASEEFSQGKGTMGRMSRETAISSGHVFGHRSLLPSVLREPPREDCLVDAPVPASFPAGGVGEGVGRCCCHKDKILFGGGVSCWSHSHVEVLCFLPQAVGEFWPPHQSQPFLLWAQKTEGMNDKQQLRYQGHVSISAFAPVM